MKKLSSQLQAKHWIAIGIMVLLAILLCRQYLPLIQLPTQGRIRRLTQQVQTRKTDLAVLQKKYQDFQKEMETQQEKSTPFWVRLDSTIPLEQEVLNEFKEIQRLSGVNIRSQSARTIKNNSSNINEVEIEIQMSGTTMQEFVRLLKEVETHGRKFYWSSCKISQESGNQNTGTLRISASLRAYLLTEEACRLFTSVATMSDEEKVVSKGKKSSTKNTSGTKKNRGGSLK